jgi:hypothetical protein
MLSFEKTPDCYRITETIMGFTSTKISHVDYKFDLSEKRCNNDPWQPTTESDKKWFNNYYLPKFNQLTLTQPLNMIK